MTSNWAKLGKASWEFGISFSFTGGGSWWTISLSKLQEMRVWVGVLSFFKNGIHTSYGPPSYTFTSSLASLALWFPDFLSIPGTWICGRICCSTWNAASKSQRFNSWFARKASGVTRQVSTATTWGRRRISSDCEHCNQNEEWVCSQFIFCKQSSLWYFVVISVGLEFAFDLHKISWHIVT